MSKKPMFTIDYDFYWWHLLLVPPFTIASQIGVDLGRWFFHWLVH